MMQTFTQVLTGALYMYMYMYMCTFLYKVYMYMYIVNPFASGIPKVLLSPITGLHVFSVKIR